jgi:hypothetical protein
MRPYAWASIVLAAVARIILAPLRALSPDEAYYLCAARRGWPIVDHPPLLGWLLAAFDRFGSIELRVRIVAIALQAATAIGIGVLSGPAFAWGVFLATWGLMSWVSGLITTPDAPLLAACVWLLVMRRSNASGILAFLAVLSKVSGLFFVLAVASTQRGRLRIATLVGGALGVVLSYRSLFAQIAHALGRGGLVSAPFVGRPLSLVAFLGGLLLYGPAVLYLAVRGRRHLDGAGVRIVIVFGVLCIASAVISGRPPEPNWIAPAFLPLLVAGATEASEMRREWLEPLHVFPAVVAIAMWMSPRELRVLNRVPPRTSLNSVKSVTDLPPYAVPSWRCVYEGRCEEIDAIFTTSKFK